MTLVRVYYQATMAARLGISNLAAFPDLRVFKQTLKVATVNNKLGVGEKKRAQKMLAEMYGMSDSFDMVALETVTNQYLGGDASLACSAETQTKIDQLVVELVKKQHEKARKLLLDNRDKLEQLAKYLYEKETITGDEFMRILEQ